MRYHTSVKSKEDGSEITFDYVWVDSKLISTVHTENNKTKTAKYIYNDFDEPVGMLLTDEETGVRRTYYYLKNAQGDITNIVSSSGDKMVEFTYDAWGKRTIHYQADVTNPNNIIRWFEQVTACALTPFGYRGYCYDMYTDLYYLQSRYYDPNTGRFINSDDTNYLNATGTVLGCNLFAYCENDGVNNVDPKGTIALGTIKLAVNFILGLLGGLVGMYLADVTTNFLNKAKNKFKRIQTIGAYVAEGIRAGCVAIFGNKIVARICTAVGTAVIKNLIDYFLKEKSFSKNRLIKDIITGVVFAIIVCGAPRIKTLMNKNNGEIKKTIITRLINFLKLKFNVVIKFFKNTFVKRFSISYAKTIGVNIKNLIFA